MDRDAIIARLRQNETALRARGVTHAALFGSCARGDQRADSDIDIMIAIAPDANVDLWEYVGIRRHIESLFPDPVEVADRDQLKPLVRASAEREAIYAF
jgi:predicted nucleotidyltransferase